MLKKVLIGLAVLVLIFVVVVALQPADFRITRSATIAAPPAVVFTQVNDLHNWDAWSPWAKLDPAARNAFDGAPAGKGAIFHWSGNNQVGEGRMTVMDSRPAELVQIKIDFVRPFAGTNIAEFSFQPEAEQTAVTWSMTGTRDFVQKAFCLVMNMEKMVGGEFEKGLAQLKQVAETKVKE